MHLLNELIDTLWNVNENDENGAWVEICELIDTLWNVNLIYVIFKIGITRINRYIMECKFQLKHFNVMPFKELIDTLWNVNELIFDYIFPEGMELIDTLWNVNFQSPLSR